MRDLVIVGSGGFGREVSGLVAAVNAVEPRWNLLGFLDDEPAPHAERVSRLGLRILGPVVEGAARLRGVAYVIGIGSGAVRERLAASVDAAGLEAVALVHPSAALDPDLEVPPGTVVCAQASVTTNVRLGRHVHVDRGATIGHDATLEAFSTLHPLACVSGSVHVGARSRLGTHSVVLPGVTVGSDVMVGAAACVVHDVPDGATVKGVPAR